MCARTDNLLAPSAPAMRRFVINHSAPVDGDDDCRLDSLALIWHVGMRVRGQKYNVQVGGAQILTDNKAHWWNESLGDHSESAGAKPTIGR